MPTINDVGRVMIMRVRDGGGGGGVPKTVPCSESSVSLRQNSQMRKTVEKGGEEQRTMEPKSQRASRAGITESAGRCAYGLVSVRVLFLGFRRYEKERPRSRDQEGQTVCLMCLYRCISSNRR